jgi:hypothetical protein
MDAKESGVLHFPATLSLSLSLSLTHTHTHTHDIDTVKAMSAPARIRVRSTWAPRGFALLLQALREVRMAQRNRGLHARRRGPGQ